MNIALDAMGGDKAPEVIVMGAREALALLPKIEKLYLVGDADTVEKECAKQGLSDARLNPGPLTHMRFAVLFPGLEEIFYSRQYPVRGFEPGSAR